MSYVGWTVLLICFLVVGTLFFSVNAIALRIFSRAKLQDAFKAANKNKAADNLTDQLTESSERLVLTCSLYRLILNMCILLLLLTCLSAARQTGPRVIDYLLTFVIAAAIFSLFGLALPHAWAKYAGEKILSRTYKLLTFFSILARPMWPTRPQKNSRRKGRKSS